MGEKPYEKIKKKMAECDCDIAYVVANDELQINEIMKEFDTLIITTAKDFKRVCNNYHYLVERMPARKLIFIGNDEVGELAAELNLGDKVNILVR